MKLFKKTRYYFTHFEWNLVGTDKKGVSTMYIKAEDGKFSANKISLEMSSYYGESNCYNVFIINYKEISKFEYSVLTEGQERLQARVKYVNKYYNHSA